MGSPSGLRLAVPTYDLLMRWCFWFYVARIAKVGLPEAKEAVAVLQLQAYIEPAGRTGKWRMTDKASWYPPPNPRFTRPPLYPICFMRERCPNLGMSAGANQR